MKNEIIRIHNLSKSYGKLQAVKNISLNVYEGELFAFLGPNGAGKSTTINILSTLLEKDAGEIEINQHILGKDNDKIRNDIGIVFQKSFLDDLLTVRENLITRASFYGLENEVITKLSIKPVSTSSIAAPTVSPVIPPILLINKALKKNNTAIKQIKVTNPNHLNTQSNAIVMTKTVHVSFFGIKSVIERPSPLSRT